MKHSYFTDILQEEWREQKSCQLPFEKSSDKSEVGGALIYLAPAAAAGGLEGQSVACV